MRKFVLKRLSSRIQGRSPGCIKGRPLGHALAVGKNVSSMATLLILKGNLLLFMLSEGVPFDYALWRGHNLNVRPLEFTEHNLNARLFDLLERNLNAHLLGFLMTTIQSLNS